MKKWTCLRGAIIAWISLFCFMFLGNLMAEDTDQKNDEISNRMISIIKTHELIIRTWVKDPVLVEAVKAQNKKDVSLGEIRRIDEEWIGGKADKLAIELQNNTVGKYLTKRVKSNDKLYVEAFLCDNKGAVVGEYPTTSDYWQGDEDKFVKCFNNGNGQSYTGPLEFNESTKTYAVQVSVPVMEDEKTIGVLVVGLKNIN